MISLFFDPVDAKNMTAHPRSDSGVIPSVWVWVSVISVMSVNQLCTRALGLTHVDEMQTSFMLLIPPVPFLLCRIKMTRVWKKKIIFPQSPFTFFFLLLCKSRLDFIKVSFYTPQKTRTTSSLDIYSSIKTRQTCWRIPCNLVKRLFCQLLFHEENDLSRLHLRLIIVRQSQGLME